MFWPLEELIHAYFARTWPITTCENQLYGDYAFQHGQNLGPENLLKLLHVALGKHSPVFSEKAVSDYGMKMRMEPGVISKGVNNHHKAWNSVREAKHSKKENLKTFPCTMAELCQKPPVVLEIDPEKNGYAEHKLPVRYWIENIVTYKNNQK